MGNWDKSALYQKILVSGGEHLGYFTKKKKKSKEENQRIEMWEPKKNTKCLGTMGIPPLSGKC